MRSVVVPIVLSVLPLAGCVTVLSHSYSNPSAEHRTFITDSGSDWGVLYLSAPTVENIVLDLEQRIGVACAGGPLTNVQTTLSRRDFVVIQNYSVRLTAECSAAKVPGPGVDIDQHTPRPIPGLSTE